MTRFRTLSLLALAVVGLTTLVCGAVTAPDAAAQKTLVVAQGAFPPSLSPGESGNPSLSILLHLHDGLTWTDRGLTVRPHLAERWETVNPTTWRFYLRKGVKFHTGEPFNAEAVKFTIDRVMDKSRPYARRGRIGLVTGVTVVDEHTVEIKTSAPFPLLPRGLRDIVIEAPQHIKTKGEQTAMQRPVGTGPFKVVEWKPNDRIVLEANADYWGGKPAYDRLVIRNIAEPSTRVAALKAGEVHVAEQIPIDLVKEVERTPNLRIEETPINMGMVITFDLLNASPDSPVKHPKVREAIDHAIDRETIWSELLGKRGAILDGQLITKGAVGYNPNLRATKYDPARAKQLLAEAGHPQGLNLTLTTPVGKYLIDRDLSLAVASQLSSVGINVKVDVLEWGAFSKQLAAKKMGPMHLIGWYNVGDADFAMVWYWTGSGRHFWENPEFDRLFLTARSELNAAKRQALLHEAGQLMSQQRPSIYLFQLPALYAVNAKVGNWMPRPDEMLDVTKATVK
jgi:peptide/nickel transport system substrate-binding protein